jgi:hypothetical protein
MPFQSSSALPSALWRAARAEVRQEVATSGAGSAEAMVLTQLPRLQGRAGVALLRKREDEATPVKGAETSINSAVGGCSFGLEGPTPAPPATVKGRRPAKTNKPSREWSSDPAMHVLQCRGPAAALGLAREERGGRRRRARGAVQQQPRAHAPGPSAAVGEAAGHGAGAAGAPSKCPFALAANFMLQDPRPPKLSPLGEVVFSSEPAAVPTPHLWCVVARTESQRRSCGSGSL